MGCSPYFAATGTHPILPFDISEATYLVPPPTSTLSTTNLITFRAIALQKRQSDLHKLQSQVMAACVQAAVQFEREHDATIRDFDFKRGDLVLIRNTAIEKALNRKMRPRYNRPVVVIARNKGGAYIISELDGAVFDCPVAAFRVIPYFAHKSLTIPALDRFIDIGVDRLRDMEDSKISDPDGDPFGDDEGNLLSQVDHDSNEDSDNRSGEFNSD
jgi:hypothetical protein